MTGLNGKTIAIVGAAGGLGSAIVRQCAGAGAQLALCDPGCAPDGTGHDSSALGQLVDGLADATRARVLTETRSITAPGVLEAFLDSTVARFGRLDGLVFAAGAQRDRGLLRLTDDDLDALVQLQIVTAMRLSREAAKRMSEHKSGSIVLVTGSAAMFGAQRQSAQGAVSAAMAGFCRGAALDLRRHGVRINTVAALAKTRVTQDLPMFQSIRSDSMTPGQVARSVTFLLGDQASQVSGEVIGAAGSRIYGIRLRESPGHFFESEFSADDVAGAFAAAVRP